MATADRFPTGQRVLVHGKHAGTVLFYGTTKFKTGVWLGLEMDRAIGKNDGEVRGVRYFTCKPSHGVFVRVDQVQVFSEQQQAAAKIQGLARKRSAQRRARGERNARAWNLLDNHQEQVTLAQSKQFKQLSQTLKGAGAPDPSATATAEPDDVVVEADYKGAHITWPLTEKVVLSLLESFKNGHTLHYKYGREIVARAIEVLGAESTVQEIRIEEGKKLTVVGDTHGQLQDLFTIFTINGLPSESNMYLFNGDFVDRGQSGIDILYAMYCFKLLYPTTVFLNRGNHESRGQNSWMGFEDEILRKYDGTAAGDPSRARRYYEQISLSFDMLPLCAMVQDKVFVCHGGLFQRSGITLDHIRAIKRKREAPIDGRTFEDKLYEELLWSDPRPTANYPQPMKGVRQSDRGAGVEFGPDVTNDFCLSNSIALVVRSHECVQEGYEVLHGGRLITIFSASRYCGTQTNKGAFITFGADLQPEIQQFYAHSIASSDFRASATPAMEEQEQTREKVLEKDTIQRIMEHLVNRKPDLYWYYTQQDKENTGSVTRLQWATGLTSVLELDLPWLSYQSQLADADDAGNINYTKFLDRYQIKMTADSQWQDGVISRVCEQLFSSCDDMRSAFRLLDKNGDGSIEYEEFMNALKQLKIDLSDLQIFELMRSVDTDADSTINYEEFASRFRVEFAMLKERRMGAGAGAGAGSGVAVDLDVASLDKQTRDQLLLIAGALMKDAKSTEDAFAKYAGGDAAHVPVDDFAKILCDALPSLTPERGAELARIVDTNRSGTISFHEFRQAFAATDSKDGGNTIRSWQHAVIQQVANVLFQHRIQLRSAFRMFDTDNNGVVTKEEFSAGLKALNVLLESPLTETQIEEMMDALDTDGDGEINFQEFIEGFQVVDMKQE